VRYWGDPRQTPQDVDEVIAKLSRIMHLADLATSVIWSSRKCASLRRLNALALEFYGRIG
jgi:hypothetical protein